MQHRTLSRLSSKYDHRSREHLHNRYAADDERSDDVNGGSLRNGFKSEGNLASLSKAVSTISSSSGGVRSEVVTPPHSPKYPQVQQRTMPNLMFIVARKVLSRHLKMHFCILSRKT